MSGTMAGWTQPHDVQLGGSGVTAMVVPVETHLRPAGLTGVRTNYLPGLDVVVDE
jgi:hypothetical protein